MTRPASRSEGSNLTLLGSGRAGEGVASPRSAWALGGFALAMVATAYALWHLGRDTTFFYDEWDFVTQRRAGGPETFLRSHNGHLNLVSVGLYRWLFGIVGLRHYGAFRGLLIISHLACCTVLFTYARRRVPDVVAVAATLLLLGAGRAWEDLLWPFQTALVLSVGAGVAALHLLDRCSVKSDVAGSVALGVSLASFSFGVPVAVGIGAELVLRRRWKRLWVVLVPGSLYGLWYLGYGWTGQARSQVSDIVPYVGDAVVAAVGALIGAGRPWDTALAASLAVLIVAVVWRREEIDRPRIAGVVATLGTFWVMTAVTRATLFPDSAGASRYLYIGAAYLVIVLVEAGRGVRYGPLLMVVLLALSASAVRSNSVTLRAGAAGLRGVSTLVKAELVAVEIAGGKGDQSLRPDEQRMPQVSAGSYLAAVGDLGSPAPSLRGLQRAPGEARTAADATLVKSYGVRLEPDEGRATGCRPIPGDRSGETPLIHGRASIAAEAKAVDVRLRRFGDDPAVIGQLARGQVARLTIPPDSAPIPWVIATGGGIQLFDCDGAAG